MAQNWRDLPAGSRERYEAARKDPSVTVGPFMKGDYRITPKANRKKPSIWSGDAPGGIVRAAKSKTKDGAPFYGDEPPFARSAKRNAVKKRLEKKRMD